MIQELTAEEHAAYSEANGKLPVRKSKDKIIGPVYDRIEQREIWIPYGEFHSRVSVMIDRLNRKHPLWTPPEKKDGPRKPGTHKPKPPKAGIGEFPDKVRAEICDKFATNIKHYVSQTRRVPPNKVRDTGIKHVLGGFNSKKWKPYGKQLVKDDVLIAMYDELRRSIGAEMDIAGG
ncbi:MAG: hypothetical protein FWG94_09920 [Oscillospiraceae bacterium]|nr:hypothetical protein [Oscillospiraceae bacterium]